jgi:hypothetical protein
MGNQGSSSSAVGDGLSPQRSVRVAMFAASTCSGSRGHFFDVAFRVDFSPPLRTTRKHARDGNTGKQVQHLWKFRHKISCLSDQVFANACTQTGPLG